MSRQGKRAGHRPTTAEVSQHLSAESPVFHGLVRGLLPLFLLTLLRERPMHGNDMMRSIEEMSTGTWKPSPGSVYPLLRRMERDGMIAGKWQRTRGAPKRVYHLTSRGRTRISKMQHDMLLELYAAQQIVDVHIAALEVAIRGSGDAAG